MPTHRDLPDPQDGERGVPSDDTVTVNRTASAPGPLARTTPRTRALAGAIAAFAVFGAGGIVLSAHLGHPFDPAPYSRCLPSVCDTPPKACPGWDMVQVGDNGPWECRFPPNPKDGPSKPCRVRHKHIRCPGPHD